MDQVTLAATSQGKVTIPQSCLQLNKSQTLHHTRETTKVITGLLLRKD